MIRQEIIDEIKNINEVLNLKYKSLYNISKEKLRSILSTGFGEFKDITPYTDKELEKIKLEGGLTVVDGSVNELGGASPHYIELYQAMSLNSNFDDEIVKSYCFSPLVDENFENKNEKFSIRDKILSKLEVECAIESVATQKPKYVFMDGSLIRFEINCKKEWDELKSSALKHNVILSGVIEDIKTHSIGEFLKKEGFLKNDGRFYDRETAFNLLKRNEALILNYNSEGKSEADLKSMFLRSSLNPWVIGVDIIVEQSFEIENLAKLIIALSSKNGRGIPMPLDLVDEKVRIRTSEMEVLIKNNMDRNNFERFFNAQRNKRTV